MAFVEAGRKVFVANRNELAVSLGKKVEIEGRELALFMQEDGSVRVLDNKCPHKGGPLSEGIVSGNYVYCPLHDWKICMKTGSAQGGDQGNVACFTVKVEGDDIYVFI
ncbi:nitrite reductase NAD(P)H small subunit [Shouchella clausii]|jgi:nitrite reductase (NADH) small subunit|uniref:Nitrite reductase (NAD(P)H) small subunit n=1 Tax=Shouchella clausii TaxID=79880 RepID=A0A268P3Y9_SHOCL|nr:nitrite reductase small subunit NirD [Shouchella clausii]KKI85020.1 nitrite reductase [Shouchella clausii]MCZ1182031.1 nitrite reductase small subunit NirD [Shouchella clausii]MDO7268576.1 nitrite reductase small subunit NirD [Shouchella clausii]MDO7288456.1 nitrite reductase small subunit NirD [Shouchella clausii]PAD48791.1 nitrite reductase (NAD(P)H) small subunit [Shouchella clausii]